MRICTKDRQEEGSPRAHMLRTLVYTRRRRHSHLVFSSLGDVAPLHMLSHLTSSPQRRFNTGEPKWSFVYGLAAASVLTQRRLTLIITSATEFINRDGLRVDLSVNSPCYVGSLAPFAILCDVGVRG